MTSETIKARFAELGAEIPIEDINSRLSTLTDQFKVPIIDAEHSVVSFFLRKHGIDKGDFYKGQNANQSVSVADIPKEDGKWLNLRAKCVQIWDSAHESMAQVGLIGDDTGRVKYTIWKNANLPLLEEGKSYSLENIVTNEWQDKISVTFNKTSKIVEIDDEIEVVDNNVSYTGVLVKIKNGSGLIKRCPNCNRALKSGACPEHGNVTGTYDLRIMGVLDDGTSVQDVLLGLDDTVALWGHTLDEAKASAVDALDAEIVLQQMKTALVGRYYMMSGSQMDSAMLAKECEAF